MSKKSDDDDDKKPANKSKVVVLNTEKPAKKQLTSFESEQLDLQEEISTLKTGMIALQATLIELLGQKNALSASVGVRPATSEPPPATASPSSETSTADFLFESQRVRALDREGEIWFVATDVCEALTIDPTATRKLDEDEKVLYSMQTPGGVQAIQIINESRLYTLILRCRDATKPGSKAHKFRKWVTSQVLPAIRKTGRYVPPEPAVSPSESEDKTFRVTLDEWIQATHLTRNREEEKARIRLVVRIDHEAARGER